MIRTFRCKDTEALFNRERCPRFQAIENAARRKLIMLNNAQSIQDLRVPPGNHLEELRGKRQGLTEIDRFFRKSGKVIVPYRGRDP